jgi:hypothetical protein
MLKRLIERVRGWFKSKRTQQGEQANRNWQRRV